MKKIMAYVENLESGRSSINYFDAPDDVTPIEFIKQLAGDEAQRNVRIRIVKIFDFVDYLNNLHDEIKRLKGHIEWLEGILQTAKKDLRHLEMILKEESRKITT